MPRTYEVLNREIPGAGAATVVTVDETGTCDQCDREGVPVLSVKMDGALDGDEVRLCYPCIQIAFVEAEGMFKAFPEKKAAK